MTITEFKQTVRTLSDICENLEEEMQFTVVFPELINTLDVQEFDKIGNLLNEVLDEF